MHNLGFNNAGARASPPFMAALLANLVPVHAKRAGVTETITVLRKQENATAVATSIDSSSNSSMLMSAGMVMTSSCFPFCNATGGIVAPASSSSSGSGSTTASSSGSVSAAPSASGAASKGGCYGGWGFLVGGVLAGLIG
jgi:hypothetical protein